MTTSRFAGLDAATKTVTGMLVGVAIDRGLVDSVTTPVSAYLPMGDAVRNPDPAKDAITVEDLLTMSSMLECDDTNPFSAGNEERMYLTPSWSEFARDLPVKGFPPWVSRPEDSPYGRSFSYCTAGVVLLGSVLERACGEPVEDFARRELFDPIGVGEVTWSRTAEGTVMTGGGLLMTTRDLARLGRLSLDSGRVGDRQVVPREWMATSTTAQVNVDDDRTYGYLWWLKDVGHAGRAHAEPFHGRGRRQPGGCSAGPRPGGRGHQRELRARRRARPDRTADRRARAAERGLRSPVSVRCSTQVPRRGGRTGRRCRR